MAGKKRKKISPTVSKSLIKKNKPSKFDSQIIQAHSYLKKADFNQAYLICVEVLKSEPRNSGANYLLGFILISHKNYIDALPFLKKAIDANPSFATARLSYAKALSELGQIDESIEEFKKYVVFKPEDAIALNSLGLLLCLNFMPFDAIQYLEQALKYNRNYGDAWSNLAMAMSSIGEHQKAITYYKKTLEVDPLKKLSISNLLLSYNYSDITPLKVIFNQHVDLMAVAYKNEMSLAQPNEIRNRKEVRVGYVSPDFHRHSVPYFLLPLIENHDRSIFKTYAYYNNDVVDDITEVFKSNVDCFQSIHNLETTAVRKMVEEDEIDILVDLTGHMRRGRLDVFAAKVAPVQVTWLGYPNTTGLPQIDYRFADKITDPEGEADEYHSEKLIRLNNGFLSYKGDNDQDYLQILPCKNEAVFTFGSFNNCEKITSEVIEAWSELLKRTKNSRILLKSGPFKDKGVRKRFLKLFSNFGIESSRVEMLSFAPVGKHLSTYDRVDLALDTFPYNGTTTTCEALWMGVPTVTYTGTKHVSRVGASIMSHVGLDDFVARDVEGYIEKAVSLSGNIDYLQSVREGMRKRLESSDLCNNKQFSEQVENAYRKMLSS